MPGVRDASRDERRYDGRVADSSHVARYSLQRRVLGRLRIVFGPDDPEAIHAYTLVGCAVGHVTVGTAEDLRQARRAVSRAIQLFMATGLSQDRAVEHVVALAQLLGGLE